MERKRSTGLGTTAIAAIGIAASKNVINRLRRRPVRPRPVIAPPTNNGLAFDTDRRWNPEHLSPELVLERKGLDFGDLNAGAR